MAVSISAIEGVRVAAGVRRQCGKAGEGGPTSAAGGRREVLKERWWVAIDRIRVGGEGRGGDTWRAAAGVTCSSRMRPVAV
jgi:hypothetical protein